MVQIVKHEWHQVDSQYTFDLTLDVLEEIYPDKTKKELKQLLKEVERGEADVDAIFNDAFGEVDIDWDHDCDDWWTVRKGGYDVTYEVV